MSKIKLSVLYSKDFKAGYVRTNQENRKILYLVKKDQNKVTNSTSYARYLLASEIGRYLNSEEEVDHIDGDKTNDILSNLQILSKVENTIKSKSPQTLIQKICPICDNTFTVCKRLQKTKTCSRSCGGKLSHLTN